MPTIPVLVRLKQEDNEFKAYIASLKTPMATEYDPVSISQTLACGSYTSLMTLERSKTFSGCTSHSETPRSSELKSKISSTSLLRVAPPRQTVGVLAVISSRSDAAYIYSYNLAFMTQGLSSHKPSCSSTSSPFLWFIPESAYRESFAPKPEHVTIDYARPG